MKQAIKKKSFNGPINFSDLRKIAGTNVSRNAEKPLEFIEMPKAFEKAVHLPGIPKGYMSIVTGWSNTGKSTLKNCLIASCQRNNILPVLFETENNMDFAYAKDCGMQYETVYEDIEVTDEETGEVTTEKQIVDYNGFFLYYNSQILCDVYGDMDYSTGKRGKTKRTTCPVIEDIAYCMSDLMNKQESGELPYDLCFIWDSVGSLGSFRSYKSQVGNNMFDAGALSASFNNIINSRIPGSRGVNSPYTNTFLCVNKIWNDSVNAVGPAASIKLKGGESFYYGARLILHVGGVAKAATKALKATAKGATYNYGIVTKIKAMKNQLPTPYNITYEGTMACVHNGIIAEEELDEYKKSAIQDIMSKISDKLDTKEKVDISETDVSFSEAEEQDL